MRLDVFVCPAFILLYYIYPENVSVLLRQHFHHHIKTYIYHKGGGSALRIQDLVGGG